jgi:Tfp pilus assembly protein PilX
MTRKLLKKSKRFRDNAGIALLTTILLLFLMSSLLVGFAVLLVSNQQLAGANNDQVVAFYAAEAGMEKMTADLGALFAIT